MIWYDGQKEEKNDIFHNDLVSTHDSLRLSGVQQETNLFDITRIEKDEQVDIFRDDWLVTYGQPQPPYLPNGLGGGSQNKDSAEDRPTDFWKILFNSLTTFIGLHDHLNRNWDW